MPTLLEINTTIGRGSTGRIVDAIGHTAQNAGWNVTVAHGPRLNRPTDLEHIIVGSKLETIIHAGWHTRVRDAHGLGSLGATRRLINTARLAICPDIIHLHNIHGYYLNYPEIFAYIRQKKIPTVWTLHDCWAFTGHCAYYSAAGCDGWLNDCLSCPNPGSYPASILYNKSSRNYNLKQSIFNSISDLLTVVTPSQWLADQVEQSFLNPKQIRVIENGIDLDTFKPVAIHSNPVTVLAAAAPFTIDKGFNDILKLRLALDADKYHIKMVGLSKKQIRGLPSGIEGIGHVNANDLARLYSEADVFVNATHQDVSSNTNREAQACGTPVVAYNVGGVADTIGMQSGRVVPENDIQALAKAVKDLSHIDRKTMRSTCRNYAESYFADHQMGARYFALFNEILNLR